MRTITVAERNLLRSGHFHIHKRVEVQDDDLAWKDLTALGGVDWAKAVSWGGNIDDPVVSGTLELFRDGPPASIAPLMSGSSLNRNVLSLYAPLLNPNRGLRIYTACVPPGFTPIPGDWRHVVEARQDQNDVAAGADTITVQFRDIGARLMNAQIEVERPYSDATGVAVETIMQQIINDTPTEDAVTLVTPVSPLWLIREYKQARVSVMEAIRTLALQIGWDVRYEWSGSNQLRLMFFEPNRVKTTPDDTFTADEYLDVKQLIIADADVRNVVRVGYVDKVTGATLSETRKDDGSILAFGRRYMEIQEASSSNIDSAVEAGDMAQAAVSDLAVPNADQQIVNKYFWPVQLGDLDRWKANGRHYDEDHDWAIVSYRHDLRGGDGHTTFTTRGKPAGAYRQWLARAGASRQPQVFESPIIGPLQAEATADGGNVYGMVHVPITFGREIQEVHFWTEVGATTPQPDPPRDTLRLSAVVRRPEGAVGRDPNFYTWHQIVTPANYFRRVMGVGVTAIVLTDGTFLTSTPDIEEIRAVDTGVGPTGGAPTSFAVTLMGTTNRITWVNADATARTLIERNGMIVFDAPAGVTQWDDAGLPTGIQFNYDGQHMKNGQTSAWAIRGAAVGPLATSVLVVPYALSMTVPQTRQLQVTPLDAAGNALLSEPVTYATSNGAVATVSATGLVTAVAVGTAKITVTVTRGGAIGTTAISVVAAVSPVVRVTISPTGASIQMIYAPQIQMSALAYDASDTIVNGAAFTWGSSQPGVATVDAAGLVTAVTVGNTNITATSNGQNASAYIEVLSAPQPGGGGGTAPAPTWVSGFPTGGIIGGGSGTAYMDFKWTVTGDASAVSVDVEESADNYSWYISAGLGAQALNPASPVRSTYWPYGTLRYLRLKTNRGASSPLYSVTVFKVWGQA